MKLFKKFLILALVCLMAFATLTACSNDKQDDENKHEHNSADGTWQVSLEKHWKVCADDNEKLDEGNHALENNICTVCGVQITLTGDSTGELCFYNEKGDWSQLITYNEDGTVVNETAEYTYDDDDNKLTMKTFKDGKPVLETEYGINEDGYSTEIKNTVYAEDGSKKVYIYNLKNDITNETTYKADGTVETELTIEYTYNENGEKELEKHTLDGKLIKEIKYFVFSADSWGGKIWYSEVTEYNADGTTTVSTYDENGESVVTE
ncbi:MAG: hypothetical protein IKU45_03535 [Clostridia bacterium]|nr:hypothetical protein [Clostridia bacterium]